MQSTVKVFVIPADRAPGGPPEPARQIVVEGRSTDAAREAAQRRLAEDGYRVRSLACGPEGRGARVEESA